MYGNLAEAVLLQGFVIVSSDFDAMANASLWVFWFYRYRRPVYYQDLILKKKGRFEATNVIWFTRPGRTKDWLEEMILKKSTNCIFEPDSKN